MEKKLQKLAKGLLVGSALGSALRVITKHKKAREGLLKSVEKKQKRSMTWNK
tara:strand:+ start:414 stop:569 length:156 start_codon:yes stop_codon:yes gene_type:complete